MVDDNTTNVTIMQCGILKKGSYTEQRGIYIGMLTSGSACICYNIQKSTPTVPNHVHTHDKHYLIKAYGLVSDVGTMCDINFKMQITFSEGNAYAPVRTLPCHTSFPIVLEFGLVRRII